MLALVHYRVLGELVDLLNCGLSVYSFILQVCVKCLLNAEHCLQYFKSHF